MSDRIAMLREGLAQLARGPAPAGRVLEVVGELLRCSTAARVDVGQLDALLAGLGAAEIKAWLRTVDGAELSARLGRAADEAVEAALPEAPEDAATWREWALQALWARDRLASAGAALARLASHGLPDAGRAAQELSLRLSVVDAAARAKVRSFTALNVERRRARDTLDASERAGAWWFTERAECDGLVARLSGEAGHDAHLAACPACRDDLSRAELPVIAPRHLGADELWRLDLGTATEAERAVAKAHARVCSACAEALRALEDGERAIVELENRVPAPRLAPAPAQAGASLEQETLRLRRARAEVLYEHAEYSVTCRRRGERLRVVVQPRRREWLAAAVLTLSGGRGAALEPRETDEGLEFELPSGTHEQRLELRARLRDGEELIALFELKWSD